jgi:hypothetical protein
LADFRSSWGLLELNPREKRGVNCTDRPHKIALCNVRCMYDRVLSTLTYASLDLTMKIEYTLQTVGEGPYL